MMEGLIFRELHTCPECGCDFEIPAPALIAVSILCDECREALKFIDEEINYG